ncbi:MAG: methyltransferase domain-containing protein [Thermoanaerobaculum sp.]|nr:methyltransferase domain-containing protein [Thermoanaerobaculum sp.]
MAESWDPQRRSWKGTLRRLVAAPFRFLLRDELHRIAVLERGAEKTSVELEHLRQSLQEEKAALASEVAAREQAFSELQQAYLATRSEFEEVRDTRLPRLAADFCGFQEGFSALQREVERLRDEALVAEAQAREGLARELELVRDVRLPKLEGAQGRLQTAHDELQGELERLRDQGLPALASELEKLHAALQRVQGLAEEVRDERLPAAVGRFEAVLGKLYEDFQVAQGLLHRILAEKPLVVPPLEAGVEDQIPVAIARAWMRFLTLYRGSSEEILQRAREYVELFREASPVLDLGCGRGELLQALTEAGIRAVGVDCDPAAVEVCRQRGLAVKQADALQALAAQGDGTLGGVACLHLVEHLPAAKWMKLVEEARRVLRPGGVLAVESPNPETLRVCGLFWQDPTHLHPVHPDAVRFVAEAVGLQVVEVRRLRPFPVEQSLTAKIEDPQLRRALAPLDHWLSGPRDFLLVARKPLPGEGDEVGQR